MRYFNAGPPSLKLVFKSESGYQQAKPICQAWFTLLLLGLRMKQTPIQFFSARIEKSGINPYVSVPVETSKAFGKRGHIPVKAP